MFCDYLTDARYEWAKTVPRPLRSGARPDLPRVEHGGPSQRLRGPAAAASAHLHEIQTLIDYLDDRVETIARRARRARSGRYATPDVQDGLRVRAAAKRVVPPRRGRPAPQPPRPRWGTYGSVHVRFGKAIVGSLPRRRTVLAVPEFDWIIDGLRQWVDEARPLFGAADHPALWVTERLTRVAPTSYRPAFRPDPRRDRARRELEPALLPPFLCDPSDRVRLPRTVRPRPGRARLRVHHGDLHLGQQRLQEPGPQGGTAPRLDGQKEQP